MGTVRIHRIVKILEKDQELVANWNRLYGGLNIHDAAMVQWQNDFRTGVITPYSLFFNLLSKWRSSQSRQDLAKILTHEGFHYIAEKLRETYPRGYRIVEIDEDEFSLPPQQFQRRNLTPTTSEELKQSLVNCKPGDTILLAGNTKYCGNFEVITILGDTGSEIMCTNAKEALHIAASSCKVNNIAVTADNGNCINVEGDNNEIKDCSMVSTHPKPVSAMSITGGRNCIENVTVTGGSLGIDIFGDCNVFVNGSTEVECYIRGSENRVVVATIKNTLVELVINGKDVFCSKVVVESVADKPGLKILSGSARVRMEKSSFECGVSNTNTLEGGSHSMLDVDFKQGAVVHECPDNIRMDRCRATKLDISVGATIVWVNCHFFTIQNDHKTSGCTQ